MQPGGLKRALECNGDVGPRNKQVGVVATAFNAQVGSHAWSTCMNLADSTPLPCLHAVLLSVLAGGSFFQYQLYQQLP